MSKYKVGDKVHWYDKERKDPTFTIGKVSSTGITFKGESIEYSFADIARIEQEGNFILAKDTQPETIYLSGTPGQLEGFRQDWVAAGYPEPNYAESFTPGNGGYVSFKQGEFGFYWNTNTDRNATPITDIWQQLLERAEKQKDNKAPIKLAGYEVELKGDTLHIGCRRVDKRNALRMLHSLAELHGILGSEGSSVTIPELLQIREWLITK